MRGRRVLMETLVLNGVRHIFGNPGTTETPLLDSLAGAPAEFRSQASKRLRDRANVVRHKNPVHAVFDQLWNPSDPRRDHRHTVGHREQDT